MGKYVVAYTGLPGQDEDPAAVRAAWEQWFEELGEAVIDPGDVFTHGKTVAADGSASDGGRLTGYTMLRADDLDAAAAMVAKCPGLANAEIQVYESVSLDAL
ncbi:YciI family protein [Nocardia mexicana]|uniref:YCII-related domain-containing protein n=1 Tax=Nocardia mexicana TaxID=279262 RepID=A0A370GSQ4_9NOCA|nr:YciI family protein [Nocardia mexicana]RDI46350.1 YCII-related domain-containing protein [Nocardia mexicana]